MTSIPSASRSLFGHLVARFSTQRENLATESLNYILSQSEVARRFFIRHLTQMGTSLPENLTYQTRQHGEDQAVPALAGLDQEGKQLLIVEAKFRAGLPEAQPVDYLNRLREQGGVCCFSSPLPRGPPRFGRSF